MFSSRFKMANRFLLSLTLMIFLQIFFPATAGQRVVLAAEQRLPYISTELPSQGYVFEVAFEAFKRVGYELEVDYYPLARAKKLAVEGKVAGLLPVYYSEDMLSHFWFSHDFPGDQVGLLKKKTFPGTIIIDSNKSILKNLTGLRQFQFGLVRGGPTEGVLESAPFLRKQFAINDLQNIDKLMAERMEFAVIDKYTAGNLLVSKRPHLIGQLEFVYPALSFQNFHVAFSNSRPDNAQVFQAFNQGLSELKSDGTLDNILERHGFFTQSKKTIENKDKTRLVIGTVNNADMLTMRKMSSEFEASHPDIKLEWRVLDENTLRQRLLSDLAISDGQFDVMTIGAYEAPIWAEKGWLTPIQKLPLDYDIEDVFLPIRETLSFNKRLYALPFYAESSGMFYRTDLFKSAGLEMPSQPTYNEVLSYAAALHKPEDGVYGICLRGKAGWGENIALISTMVNTHGGQWFDKKWQPQLNSTEWTQALTMYITLLSKYGPPKPTDNGYIENLALFSAGKCGMWIDATIAAGRLFNPLRSEVSQHVGLVNAPIAKTKKGAKWLWAWALAVPESSKYKNEALEFITWATSKKYIQLVAELEGGSAIPSGTRASTYSNKTYVNNTPYAKYVLDAIQHVDTTNSTLHPKPYAGIQFVAINEFPAIGNQVGALIERVLKKELSISQALTTSQTLVDKQMKASNYY